MQLRSHEEAALLEILADHERTGSPLVSVPRWLPVHQALIEAGMLDGMHSAPYRSGGGRAVLTQEGLNYLANKAADDAIAETEAVKRRAEARVAAWRNAAIGLGIALVTVLAAWALEHLLG